MNRDLALLATPAVARRLLLLQRAAKMQLPEGLAEIAAQEVLTEAEFDPLICCYSPVRATIAQFLIDNNLRGIVQARYHPEINELAMLFIARLARVPLISILTRRSAVWRRHAASLFLTNLETVSWSQATGQWIDKHRHGVLILDLTDAEQHYDGRSYNRFIREFPQTIFYQSVEVPTDALVPWTELASILFPTMPHPLITHRLRSGTREWQSRRLRDYALLYNFCLFPEFIQSSKLLSSLEIDA